MFGPPWERKKTGVLAAITVVVEMLAAPLSVVKSKGTMLDPFRLKLKVKSFQSEEARNAVRTATIWNTRVSLMTVRVQR